MSQTIRLIHISDLHARVANKAQIALRVQAFLDDLSRQGQRIDAVLFTGDMAFAGRPEEYDLAERILLTPLMQRFGLSKEQIFVIPGNHDVDRSVVDPFAEEGLVKKLQSSEDAETVLEHPQHSLKRLKL